MKDNAALAADAYLAWWQLAGVDCAVGHAPVDWLRAPAVAMPTPRPAADARPAADTTPRDFEAFRRWLENDPAQPERRWSARAIGPTGPADAPLMIVTDMPDPADMEAGALLADRAGLLFDAMLRAIGLDRGRCHVASLFCARPPGGMVEAADIATAADRMRLHVMLARPRRLLLLGDRTIRALMPDAGPAEPNGLRDFNHQGGIVPAVATFHPRLLLGQPAAKAECWRALQSLIEETRP
jgi:DNA polymerase